MNNKEARLTILLEEQLKDKFFKKCDDNRHTPSVEIRRMIEDYVNK